MVYKKMKHSNNTYLAISNHIIPQSTHHDKENESVARREREIIEEQVREVMSAWSMKDIDMDTEPQPLYMEKTAVSHFMTIQAAATTRASNRSHVPRSFLRNTSSPFSYLELTCSELDLVICVS